jgi:predicted MFS family arabinose efflux permease
MTSQSRYEWGLVALMFCVWGTLFLDRLNVLFVAPYLAPDLHISAAQIGQLAGIIAVTWALSTLVFGIISDRIGRRRVLIPMIFAFSIMSCVSGLAQNFHQLLLARALMGVAEGPCWSVMNAIVASSSRPATRGRNVGLVVSAAGLVGLALAPVMGTQIAAHYGWRASFFVAGVPGLILGVIAMFYVREPARAEATESHQLRLSDIGLLLGNRNVLLCCLGCVGFISWLFLQSAFGPLFITKAMHQDPRTAGLLLGAAGLGSFILGFVGPSLATKYGQRKIVLIFAVLSFFLPLALIYPPLYAHLPLLAAVLFCTQGGHHRTRHGVDPDQRGAGAARCLGNRSCDHVRRDFRQRGGADRGRRPGSHLWARLPAGGCLWRHVARHGLRPAAEKSGRAAASDQWPRGRGVACCPAVIRPAGVPANQKGLLYEAYQFPRPRKRFGAYRCCRHKSGCVARPHFGEP